MIVVLAATLPMLFFAWLRISSMDDEIKYLRGQVEYYRGMWDRQVLWRREPEDDADWWKSGEHE